MSIDLELATSEQIANELAKRPNTHHALLWRHKNAGRNDWELSISDSIDEITLALMMSKFTAYMLTNYELRKTIEQLNNESEPPRQDEGGGDDDMSD